MRKALFVMIVAILSTAMFTPVATASWRLTLSYSNPMKFDDTEVYTEPAASFVEPLAGAKWAVVIGIADYQGRDSDLWHPDEDAKEMYAELTRQQGYPRANVKLLTNKGATASAISSAITWLVTNEKAGDEVVFFFSGHGYRALDSEGWDTDVETDGYDEVLVTYDFYGLSDGWLAKKFVAIESTKFALMFGSCYSGGMFDDDDDLQGTGRVIVSACKADQLGWDYLLLGNTLWGYYFVDEGLLDNNANSVETAHAYAYPRVVAQQPNSQPQLYDNYLGDFIL
jgi:hypothetical protein